MVDHLVVLHPSLEVLVVSALELGVAHRELVPIGELLHRLELLHDLVHFAVVAVSFSEEVQPCQGLVRGDFLVTRSIALPHLVELHRDEDDAVTSVDVVLAAPVPADATDAHELVTIEHLVPLQ